MGGAKVTQIISIVMIGSALGVAYYLQAAYPSATPEQYFVPFLLLFLVLFAATGIGNGSTFRTIAHGVQQGTGRPGAGLDLGRGRLRRLLSSRRYSASRSRPRRRNTPCTDSRSFTSSACC